MNRLQKKCFIVSTGVHLLLAVILIVGPAFLSSRRKLDDSPVLNFVPSITVDAAISGGGSPTAKPPAPAPPEPVAQPPQAVAPVPPPQPQPKPVESVKVAAPEPPKVPRPSPDAIEPVKPPKHTIEVSDKIVTTTSSDAKAAAAARAKKAAKEAADAKRRTAELNRTLANLKNGLSSSTSVDLPLPGPGGGGVPYANFYTAVRTVYYNAWRQPDGVPEVTVKVSVVIGRDGTVISARIVDPSGNAKVDSSVQDTLDRVKFAAPLPENAKEDQRTVPINFNIQATTTG